MSLPFHLRKLWHATCGIALDYIDELLALPTLHILAIASEQILSSIVERT